MIQGYVDTAQQANVRVGGGQSVYNMWPMLGGCAIAAVTEDSFRWPNNAQVGDTLVLTKPLGMRLAINTMQWLKSDKQKREKMLKVLPESTILETFYRAEAYMATLNMVGARLLRKYKSNACTDVTGFGVLGHANYLAQAQKNNVKFVIESLPILKDLHRLETEKVTSYKLLEGYAAETSGGLLVALNPSSVDGFVQEMHDAGLDAWKIGKVVEGNKTAEIVKNYSIIDV